MGNLEETKGSKRSKQAIPLPSTRLETYEDFGRNAKVYKVTISAVDYTLAQFSQFDYALLDDIDNGEPSSTPLADKLLGLEMIVRRIEEAHAKSQAQGNDMAATDSVAKKRQANPPKGSES